MIAYTTIGTNDFDRAVKFYSDILGDLGAKPAWTSDRFAGFSAGEGQALLAIVEPFDGEKATAGNGTMVALSAPDKATVEAVHAKALDLGATDEGEPGVRAEHFYMAYFRDHDGNKIALFTPNK